MNISWKRIVLYIVCITLIFFAGLIIGSSLYQGKLIHESDKKEKYNNVYLSGSDKNDPANAFDFNTFEKDLNSLISSGHKPKLALCTSNPSDGEYLGYHDEVSYEYVEISSKSVNSIINMLQNANSFIKMSTFLNSCPPKDIKYVISDSNNKEYFSLFYLSKSTGLNVSYNNENYIFFYENNDIYKNFIETLK